MSRSTRARLGLMAAIFAGGMAILAAQVPGRSAFPIGTATISGRVLDAATNQPIADASVMLFRDNTEQGPRTSTGVDGTFTFSNLPVGATRIEAHREGYVFSGYGKKRPDGGSVPLIIADGANVTDITIRMWTSRYGDATVSGVVKDERGKPIARVPVRAMRRSAVGQWETELVGTPTMTGDAGEFTLRVSAGRLVVNASVAGWSYPSPSRPPVSHASAPPQRLTDVAFLTDPSGRYLLFPQFLPPAPDRDGNARAYAPAFHGGATVGTARVLDVAPGASLKDIDITLSTTAGRRVSGVITGPRGPVHGAAIRLLSDDEDGVWYLSGPEATSAEDGRFDFVLVADGTYQLEAVLRLPPYELFASPDGIPTRGQNDSIVFDPDGLWLRRSLTVAGDITDLSLTMRTGTVVTIKIVSDDGRALTPARGSISLDNVASIARGGVARSVEPGTFRGQVVPGRYSVNVNGLAAGSVPISLTRSGKAVPGQAIEVGEEPIADVELTLTSRPATLTGTIVDAQGRPAPDAVVVLMPADRSLWNTWIRNGGFQWYQRTARTTTGGYRIENLPPSEYLIVAVDDSALQGWPRAGVLEQMAKIAAPITLTSGTQTAPVLRLR